MTGADPIRRAALVYNPIKRDAQSIVRHVVEASARHGWAEPLLLETTVDDAGAGVAREAVAAGVDVVVSAGGDGTVRAIAEGLAGTLLPLAIVPRGTGNLLARNLRLPLDSGAAMVEAAFTGDELAVDVGIIAITRPDGEIEERAFVVMGGIGLDAAMIANTRPTLKKRVGWVAYVAGAARSLPGAKPFRVVYKTENGRLHAARVQSVLFASCGSLPAGLELIPGASVVDGELDVVVFQPKGALGWLFVWRRVAWENSFLGRVLRGRTWRRRKIRTADSAVVYERDRGVDIAAAEPHHVQLDGDEFGLAREVRVRVHRGALIVRLPRGHDTTTL